MSRRAPGDPWLNNVSKKGPWWLWLRNWKQFNYVLILYWISIPVHLNTCIFPSKKIQTNQMYELWCCTQSQCVGLIWGVCCFVLKCNCSYYQQIFQVSNVYSTRTHFLEMFLSKDGICYDALYVWLSHQGQGRVTHICVHRIHYHWFR